MLKAMKALYDTAVVHKVSWRTATSRANTLSPQLAAMLDGMLEPNPDKRYTLQQVAECEWLRLPLPPKLQVRDGQAAAADVGWLISYCMDSRWHVPCYM